jgi:2,2-dialkylglycine decarboxylase (pyruvate)
MTGTTTSPDGEPGAVPRPSSRDLLAEANDVLIRSSGSDYTLPVIGSGRGTTITDVDGRDYLDLSSGQMCATLGHNHPRITDALHRAADRILHVNSAMLTEDVIQLGRRVVDLLPPPLEKVLFLSTGGESTEAALRMAKKATGRWEIVALADSFHGSTMGALSSTFMPRRRGGQGPMMPGTHAIFSPNCYRCPLGLAFPACDYACARTGFELVDRQSVGALAALIAEPIQGSAGYVEPPPGYLGVLRDLCRERDMLLVLDEAQTGFGRTGDMWGFERDAVLPDIVAMSKTLGGGLPLAAVATSSEIEARAHERGFWFYTSHLNEPLAVTVGLAVLDVIRDERLVEAARDKGDRLRKGLLALRDRYEIVGDVRGRGLLLGVDLVEDRETKRPAERAGEAITRRCLERGLFVQAMRQPGRSFVWRIAPPLTIAEAEIDRALAILDESIRSVTGAR